MSCEKIFIKQLRERGCRLTPQREMVLSVMHQIEGFATAEEIWEKVTQISDCVDISTVYRTLELLQEFQIVAAIDPGNGQRRYELVGVHGPHCHLVCRSCGKVIGVEQSEVKSLVEHLEETHGFAVEINEMTIPGLCRECRAISAEILSLSTEVDSNG